MKSNNYFIVMKQSALFAIAGLLSLSINAANGGKDQKTAVFNSQAVTSISQSTKVILDKAFTSYHIYQINSSEINAFAKQNKGNFTLQLNLGNTFNWNLDLVENNLLADDYFSQVSTDKGIIRMGKPAEIITYKGIANGNTGNPVRLTITEQMVTGAIDINGESYFIQPLSGYDQSVSDENYLVYNAKDLIETEIYTCGIESPVNYQQNAEAMYRTIQANPEFKTQSAACKTIPLAIAADSLFTRLHGGTKAGAEAYILSVVNILEGHYNYPPGNFTFNLHFQIASTFISITKDPWPLTTYAPTFRPAFRDWAEAGGFGISRPKYLIGSLYTRRNMCGVAVAPSTVPNCSIIGQAYWSGSNEVCPGSSGNGANAYNVIENSTSTDLVGTYMGLIQAHENCHLFGYNHDPQGPTVQAPTLTIDSKYWTQECYNATVSGINAASCIPVLTSCEAIKLPTSIAENRKNEGLNISPNPSSGFFTISYPGAKEENATIELYDLLGNKIYTRGITIGNSRTESLDLRDKAKGVYLLRIIGQDHQMIQRVVNE